MPEVVTQISKDLIEIVGKEMFDSWILMIRGLAPGGRTHRTSVVVGGMIEFAAKTARYKKIENNTSRLFEMKLDDPDLVFRRVLSITKDLFECASIDPIRTNSNGQKYSAAECAAREYMNWDLMPWERY